MINFLHRMDNLIGMIALMVVLYKGMVFCWEVDDND